MVSSYLGSSNFEDYLGPADYNKFHPDHGREWSVVMCWLWPEARGCAKPSQAKPGPIFGLRQLLAWPGF